MKRGRVVERVREAARRAEGALHQQRHDLARALADQRRRRAPRRAAPSPRFTSGSTTTSAQRGSGVARSCRRASARRRIDGRAPSAGPARASVHCVDRQLAGDAARRSSPARGRRARGSRRARSRRRSSAQPASRSARSCAVDELDRADVDAARRLADQQHPRRLADLAREHELLLVAAGEARRCARSGVARAHVEALHHRGGVARACAGWRIQPPRLYAGSPS